MKLDLTPLLNGRSPVLNFDYSFDPAEAEDACELPEEITLTAPVRVEGKITDLGVYMTLDARVSSDYETVCDRCLAPISSSVSFEYSRIVSADEGTDADDDTVYIKDGGLVLDADITEMLSLELPVYHLCSESCPGLCCVCGKRLDGSCKCSREKEIDPRLEIFKKILDKSEER